MPAYKFVEDILEPWLRETRQDKKHATQVSDAYCASVLIPYFKGCYVSGSKSRRMKIIDGVMVRGFREWAITNGKNDNTTALIINKAAAACDFAIKEKNYDMPNPFAGRAKSRAGKKRSSKSRHDVMNRRLWMPEDEDAFYQSAPRFVADVVRFALSTGCRLGEILNLVDCDCYDGEEYQRIEGNQIVFSPSDQKSNYWGACYMNDEALKILRRQTPALVDGKVYLFTWNGKVHDIHTFNHHFVKARKEAGITLKFKDTRRTCGQRMLDNGADLEGVQAQLRHESIMTTQQWYVRPASSRAELAVKYLN